MHADMLEVNGQKMSKSFGNYFLPMEIVNGTSELFEKPFSANVVRFAMMQAHYRSPMDISYESLIASEKGLNRLLEALKSLSNLGSSENSSSDVNAMIDSFYKAMNDDFNTPILVANLFDAVKFINSVKDGKATISKEDLENLKLEMNRFSLDILGLKNESSTSDDRLSPVMDLVLDLRQNARTNKDWTTSDQIRDGLAKAGIVVKDGKDGTEWS